MDSCKKDTDFGPGFYLEAANHPPFSAAAWLVFGCVKVRARKGLHDAFRPYRHLVTSLWIGDLDVLRVPAVRPGTDDLSMLDAEIGHVIEFGGGGVFRVVEVGQSARAPVAADEVRNSKEPESVVERNGVFGRLDCDGKTQSREPHGTALRTFRIPEALGQLAQISLLEPSTFV